MNALILYLLKSSLWLSAFALVYYLFLRNQRLFFANRIFLIAGILASIILPFFTFSYPTLLVDSLTHTEQVIIGELVAGQVISEDITRRINWVFILPVLFAIGLLALASRLLYQTSILFKEIVNSPRTYVNDFTVIESNRYPAPFSFFSYVFINPSVNKSDMREIVRHEAEHIKQYHCIDLMLSEIVRLLLWFNPVAWLYGHFVRQNHEYLADNHAIQNCSNPAIYRAVLINQMVGGEAIRLGNMFCYSLNKKRFTMMTKQTTTALQKLKFLWILPAIAFAVYACMKVDEHVEPIEINDIKSKAYIPIIKNDIPANITREEFEVLLQPDQIQHIEVIKDNEVAINRFGDMGKNGLAVVTMKNGDIIIIINPSNFHTDYTHAEKPVVPSVTNDGEQVFMVVEDMPQFPGGITALREYLSNATTYPIEAINNKIEGRVYIQFIINSRGAIESPSIIRGVDPIIDNEALRVVQEMPDWQPGRQRNIPVAVSYTVPINFVLNNEE